MEDNSYDETVTRLEAAVEALRNENERLRAGLDATGWLIETGSAPFYLYVNPCAKTGEWPFAFTTILRDALRFARKEDADALRRIAAPGEHVRSVQRSWEMASPHTSAQRSS